jgi:hypothetical protein
MAAAFRSGGLCIRDSHAGWVAQLPVVRAVRVFAARGRSALCSAVFSFPAREYLCTSRSSGASLDAGVAPINAKPRKRAGRIKGATNRFVERRSEPLNRPSASAQSPIGATQSSTDLVGLRVYPLDARVVAGLEARRDQFNDPERYVFGAESGAYVASFDKSWQELFRHAGLPVGRKGGLTWHDLRHEFMSVLADQGGEIHEVREAARHKDIRTTERYMKAREERLKALMSKLADRSA